MARSGFYTPGLGGGDGQKTGYGGDRQWTKAPFHEWTAEPLVPQGVYTAFLGNLGLGGQDRKSQWLRNKYGETQSGYQAAWLENPELVYSDYLRQQFGKVGLENMWRSATPGQRGEQPGMWAGPTRTIGWG